MVCIIKENIPDKELYIQPCGMFQKGKEVLEGELVQGLNQTFEKYSFHQKDGYTEVVIEAAMYEDLEDFFKETWPQALELIKTISESNTTL